MGFSGSLKSSVGQVSSFQGPPHPLHSSGSLWLMTVWCLCLRFNLIGIIFVHLIRLVGMLDSGILSVPWDLRCVVLLGLRRLNNGLLFRADVRRFGGDGLSWLEVSVNGLNVWINDDGGRLWGKIWDYWKALNRGGIHWYHYNSKSYFGIQKLHEVDLNVLSCKLRRINHCWRYNIPSVSYSMATCRSTLWFLSLSVKWSQTYADVTSGSANLGINSVVCKWCLHISFR